MAKTRQNNHDSSWSDLTHDVLLVIMMKVGVVDFLPFSRVCKSWRSLALSNKKKFTASKQPMLMWILRGAFKEDCCYLEDSNGRKIKRTLPHSGTRTLIGLTCGYLVLYRRETREFWLVNPVTNHELHFPGFPFYLDDAPRNARVVLVFSPLMSRWVFFMGHRNKHQIWFSIAGKATWNHVFSNHPIMDLHAFKGKIYTITLYNEVCKLTLNPEPEVTLLETKNVLDREFLGWKIVSFGDNLYVVCCGIRNGYAVLELDIDEMKWVHPKNTRGYAYLVSLLKHGAYDIKPPDSPQYDVYMYFDDESRKDRFHKMWYYTHDCMSVDIIHER